MDFHAQYIFRRVVKYHSKFVTYVLYVYATFETTYTHRIADNFTLNTNHPNVTPCIRDFRRDLNKKKMLPHQ